MISKLFSGATKHPLSDPKMLRQVLSELARDNFFKTIDEIYRHFESLRTATDWRIDYFFNVVRQLDDAAQPALAGLTRDYLHAQRLSKNEERRLWSISASYWKLLAELYKRCVTFCQENPRDKGSEALKSSLPLLSARLIGTYLMQIKWVVYRYEVIPEKLWLNMGEVYLTAEAGAYAQQAVLLYPGQSGPTSITQQYLHALLLSASSMDSLMPPEIDLADKLLAHCQRHFLFSRRALPSSMYWINAEVGLPPIRLVREPSHHLPTLRFISAAGASEILKDLHYRVEGGQIPSELNLAEFSPKFLAPILQHLADFWSSNPPQREHQRHFVKTRMAVLQGFDDSFTVFSGSVARLGKERNAQSWVVENASLGGFSAGFETLGEQLKISTLLSMQPEGGDNWVLGVVRRYNKQADNKANVGIQTLSKQAQSIELRQHGSGALLSAPIPSIWLREAKKSNEAQLLLPPMSFSQRAKFEFDFEHQTYLLTPILLQESGAGYELGRYWLALLA